MNLTIEQTEALIVEAERDVEEAEASLAERKAVLRFMRRHLESLRSRTATLPGMATTFSVASPPSVEGMTIPDAVLAVLKFEGVALHVREIRKRLLEGGFRDRNNLEISITSALRRRDDLFVKVSKATYDRKNGVT